MVSGRFDQMETQMWRLKGFGSIINKIRPKIMQKTATSKQIFVLFTITLL